MGWNLLEGERGASAVLIAGSMLLMMGFAAIAIDYGAAVNERRLDQSTADTAVLSAGVEIIVSGDVQLAVDSAKSFTNQNLNRVVSDADWAACVDSAALEFPSNTIPGVTNGSNCISFGENDSGIAYAKIRVRLPDQTSPPIFSRILGSAGIVTSASAEVQLDTNFASGAFPSGVFSGASAGESFCIKTGTTGQESCGASTTGDFGNFQPYFYTELATGNPSTECTSGNQPDPLSRVIADGLDHFLGTTLTPTGSKTNGASCPGFPGPLFPDRVDSGGGNSNADVTDGLILGGNYDGAFSGRLTRKVWGGPYDGATIFGQSIDNRPLWSYIDSGVLDGTTPAACLAASMGPAQHDDSSDLAAESTFVQAQNDLVACLSDPNVPDSLFVEELYESPRLTIVPRYWESAPLASNACCYNIKAFVPVFIDGIWTGTGPLWTCDGGVIEIPGSHCKHEPGRVGSITISAVGQQRLSSASAIVLNCDVLPDVPSPQEKCKKVGSGVGTEEIYLNLYLTK
jgi:hypothetical protein